VLAKLSFELLVATLDSPLTIHLLNEQALLGKGQAILHHWKAHSINQRRPGTSYDHRPPLKEPLTWID
jgi:hypothetical protein